jgi:hypothetical protein
MQYCCQMYISALKSKRTGENFQGLEYIHACLLAEILKRFAQLSTCGCVMLMVTAHISLSKSGKSLVVELQNVQFENTSDKHVQF